MPDIYDRVVEHLRAHSASKIWDVGCSYGELGLRLRASGFRGTYKGLDKDADAIEELKANGLKGEEGDLRWYDGMKFYWDTVVCKDVLEELNEFSLLCDAILRTRRVFILVTQAQLYDSISPPPTEGVVYNVDDILFLANKCSFFLHHYEMVGNHSILIFLRRKKKKK